MDAVSLSEFGQHARHVGLDGLDTDEQVRGDLCIRLASRKAGAFLLVLAGLSFFWFAHALSCEAGSFRVPLLITGAAAVIAMAPIMAGWVPRWGAVTDLGDGRFRFRLGDGSTWELSTPAGVAATFSDARATLPYADTAEFSATLGPAHTLVVLTPTLVDNLDLTTTLVRLGP